MTQALARIRQGEVRRLTGEGERFQRAYAHVKGRCKRCMRSALGEGTRCRSCEELPCATCAERHRCEFDDLMADGQVLCSTCGRAR